MTEVVVTLLRLLGPAKNGNGAKSTEPPRAVEKAEDADNPFNDAETEIADQANPY